MRKLSPVVFVFCIILFYSCASSDQNNNEKVIGAASNIQKDTFHLLCKYWQLFDAGHPTSKDVSFTDGKGILFQSGIVFMTDSSVLENPGGKNTYGKFKVNGNFIKVNFDDGRKVVYQITRLYKDTLLLTRTENKHTSELTYTGTSTYWPDTDKNPFSKQNYQWSRKPQNPESEEAIRNRVKDNVRFYIYYFDGFIIGGADKINFEALPCCLNWYVGGITIQSENKLDKKWADCFYSEEQAFKGRQILQDALLQKYDWDATQVDWLKQTVQVLQQVHDRL